MNKDGDICRRVYVIQSGKLTRVVILRGWVGGCNQQISGPGVPLPLICKAAHIEYAGVAWQPLILFSFESPWMQRLAT